MLRALVAAILLMLPLPSYAQGPGELEGEARETIKVWREVQGEARRWEEERRRLLEERERLRLQVQGLEGRLERLRGYNANLSSEIAYLEGRLEELGRYREELEPYLFRILGEISSLIEEGLPFSLEERRARVERAKGALQDPDLPLGEKLRAVLEMLRAELEYSRTVEAKEGVIPIGGVEREVHLLRAGRIGLYWLSLDGEEGGWFDPERGEWVRLKGYEGELRRFLEMAQGKRAAELIRLPLGGVK